MTTPHLLQPSGGFTLVELMMVVAVVGILLGLAMPELNSTLRESRGMQCAGALRQIEAAKDAWVADNPGQVLTNLSQLGGYLKYGMPSCPSGGSFSQATSLYQKASCSKNFVPGGNLSDYPEETARGTDYSANGYHDLGQH